MPTFVSPNGLFKAENISVEQYNQFARQFGVAPLPEPMPMPAFAAPSPAPYTGPTLNKRRTPSGATSTTPSTATPCEVYEKAKAAGQSTTIIEIHRKRCQAWQEAQAFAVAPPPLTQDQLAIMADEQMAESDGMSLPMKIGIAAGILAIVGGIVYAATR